MQGISLTVEQYTALISLLPQIESSLNDKGQEVPRPEFGASKDGLSKTRDIVDEDHNSRKTNIEATSDEDEE